MAFTVRLFAYRGLRQIPQTNPTQFTSDTVFTDTEPYEYAQALVSNGAVPVSSAAVAAPDQTAYWRIEVPDGQSIRYEINPPNRVGGVQNAGPNSPILSGINRFEAHQGWTLSFIDASGT